MNKTLKHFKNEIYKLKAQGIELWTSDGKLNFKAGKHQISEEIMTFLKTYKDELMDVLEQEGQDNTFPLTPIQSAYLLGSMDSFEYGGVSSHIYMELEYLHLDKEKVEHVWMSLIDRHEMLRTTINHNGYQGELEQMPKLEIYYEDLTTNGVDDWNRLDAIRQQLGSKRYSPDCWPLFDIALSKRMHGTTMHISFDFLIVDWASIWILIKEFEVLYFNENATLPNNDFTFKEYVKLEEEMSYQEKYKEDKAYWYHRVLDLPTSPTLPKLPLSQDEKSFERYFIQLEKNDWDKLKLAIANKGITATSVLFTLYSQCLAKWSVNKHFIINLILLNRLPVHPDVNHIVGDFTSINLTEADFRNAQAPFINNVNTIQQQMFRDLDHSSFSGVEVLREITRQKGQTHAFMPFVFTSAINLIDSHGLIGKMNEYGISQTPQVFIDCQVMDDDNGLRVNWDVRKGVFPANLIQDMFLSFETALKRLVHDDKAWESTALVTLPKQQIKQRESVNFTKNTNERKRLLHQGFFDQAWKQPNKIAMIEGNHHHSYQDLRVMVFKLGTLLQKHQVKEGDKVAIISDKPVYQVTSVLAILSLGAVYVPIDKAQPISRIKKIIDQSQVTAILIDERNSMYDCLDWRLIICSQLEEVKTTSAYDVYKGDPDTLAYIIFTSGSTGEPKGVAMSHAGAMNTIQDINRRFCMTSNDRVLALSKLHFDLSVYDIFGLLSVGGTIVYPEQEHLYDASYWLECIRTKNITLWNTVPALMKMLLSSVDEIEQINIKTMKTILLSGDWIPPKMVKHCSTVFPESSIVALGGATEAGIWSNYHLCCEEDFVRETIPYGYPLANQRFYVLDEKDEDCPNWVRGELYIGGESLALGYYNNPQLTKERFITNIKQERIYKTGDFGRYMDNGEIEFIGRLDNQVKLRGNLVNLGEIESLLNKYERIDTSCVVVLDDTHLYAVVKLVNHDSQSIIHSNDLIDYLANLLPQYMVPVKIFIVAELKLNANDKLDRQFIKNHVQQLVAECTKDDEIGVKQTGMENQLQQTLIHFATEVLNVEHIQVSKNLYDYGADSLTLSQLAGKIKKTIENDSQYQDITFDFILRQLLNEPIIESIAQKLNQSAARETNGSEQIGELNSSQSIGLLKEESFSYGDPLRIVVHAGLGTMNAFQYLNKHLAKQGVGTVVSISVQDINKYLAIDSSVLIDCLADDYVLQIMDREPSQVQLIGYCMGGLIALEIARRLMERGVEIIDFTLIDSAPVLYEIEDSIPLELIFITNFYITVEDVYEGASNNELMDAIMYVFYQNNESLSASNLEELKNEPKYETIYRFLKKLSQLSRKQRFKDYKAVIEQKTGQIIADEMLEGYYNIYLQSFKGSNIRPMAYFGDIRYLVAKEDMDFIFTNKQDTLKFWKELCIGDFEETSIEGNHITCIEDDENACKVAEKLLEPINKLMGSINRHE
ncbi:amino acid adenylation domain-containing protein [Lysinibacillus sphaericus]|uniref:amino acid adenylation domain-containing protein n=1 Tax=Lysinibacillus sphaericus TaxID=1421 RepID=UPI003CFDB4E7